MDDRQEARNVRKLQRLGLKFEEAREIAKKHVDEKSRLSIEDFYNALSETDEEFNLDDALKDIDENYVPKTLDGEYIPKKNVPKTLDGDFIKPLTLDGEYIPKQRTKQNVPKTLDGDYTPDVSKTDEPIPKRKKNKTPKTLDGDYLANPQTLINAKLSELLEKGEITLKQADTFLKSKNQTIDEFVTKNKDIDINPSDYTSTSSYDVEEIIELPEVKRYTKIKEIGRGGMGAVYRAYDTVLGRNVALKINLKNKNNSRKRFAREAKITASLEHPNIMTVHDKGVIKGKDYLALKFIENARDLSYITEGTGRMNYNRRELLQMMKSVCDAMAFIHNKDIIHRDLKPHNIMLDQLDNVYVADFGLAKKITEEDPVMEDSIAPNKNPSLSSVCLTKDGVILGSVEYMPPEQVEPGKELQVGRRTKILEVDKRSDIYSVGAILYEMVVGEKFRNDSEQSLIYKAMENIFKKPRSINSSVEPELESIILKALSTDPDDRYQTFEDFSEDITNFLSNQKVTAHDYGVYAKVKKWVQNHPAKTLLGVASTVLVAGTAFSVMEYRNQALQKELAEEKTKKVEKKLSEKEKQEIKRNNELLEQAIKRNKAQEKIWFAETLIRRGNSETAIKTLDEAIKIDDTYSNAYFYRGLAYSNTFNPHNVKKAISDLEKANQLSVKETGKQDFRALYERVMVEFNLNSDLFGAIRTAKEKTSNLNNDESYFRLLKILANIQKDANIAIHNLTELIKKDNTFSEAYFLRSILKDPSYIYELRLVDIILSDKEYTDRKKSSSQDAQKALNLEPNNVRFLYQYASTISNNSSEEKIVLDKIPENSRVPLYYFRLSSSLL